MQRMYLLDKKNTNECYSCANKHHKKRHRIETRLTGGRSKKSYMLRLLLDGTEYNELSKNLINYLNGEPVDGQHFLISYPQHLTFSRLASAKPDMAVKV